MVSSVITGRMLHQIEFFFDRNQAQQCHIPKSIDEKSKKLFLLSEIFIFIFLTNILLPVA